MSIDARSIRSADWSPEVGSIGQVVEALNDIRQAISILLKTPKGSDPHRPEFGCDAWRYLDKPVTVAVPNVIRECTDAVERWEPRAKLKRITWSVDGSTLELTLEWTAALAGQTQTQQVSYGFVDAA
ncbi:GPW/gp25 family protein [Fundidesulfovibrio putealis]|uniref:GPW/gp25 family protein n=1 Tax=Fundidesulfovibrio putealis TaxID=270496 RepID=UPI0004846028|nr:GPW/gp25 family protein [Fundidesulfovibrio putealis]